MRARQLILVLLVPVLFIGARGKSGYGHSQSNGKKTGDYTLKLVGDLSGQGSVSVASMAITLTLNITLPNGTSTIVTFSNLPLKNNRFTGSTSYGGGILKVAGRVDVPASNDDQESLEQAITARVTATVADNSGKASKLVAIQDESSRGTPSASGAGSGSGSGGSGGSGDGGGNGNGNGNGDGGGNGNGNGNGHGNGGGNGNDNS